MNLAQINIKKILENIKQKKIFLDTYPEAVHFLLNDYCNAKCIMCGGNYINSNKKITFEKFKIMCDNLNLNYIRRIAYAGAGDPLLNSELKLMIEYIYKNFPHIFTCITTNGIALTSEKFGYLIENKIGFINVSINAATRKTYKRIMQVDCFDKVVENMIALQRYKQKMNSNLPELQMSFVANRLNIEELPILLEIAENVNCQKINIMYCRFYPSAIRNLNLISQENILKDEFSLFYHKDLSDKIIEEVKKRAIDKNIILTTEPLFKEDNKKFECCWPFKEILIGFNGEIYPCGGGELHFKEKIQKGIYDSGNILKEKIEDIWNKKFYLDLRKTVLENIETTEDCIIPECACCANRMIVNSKKSHIMEWVD